MTRRQLSDEQWQLIEPFLPIGDYGPYPERLREQFEGVIWRFRTSSQWREMPGEFGPWPTVYGRFRVWRDAGIFTVLLEGMIAEAARQEQADLSLVSVDSTTVRAHHDAAGMRIGKEVMDALEEAAADRERARQKGGGPPERNGQDGSDAPGREERRHLRRRRKLRLKEALLGRSRGGLTSKIHLAADRKCRPLSFVLTAGQAADSPQFVPVLQKVRVRLPVGRPRTPARGCRRGQGLHIPRRPLLPAQTQHQGRHPGEEGPGRQPEEERQPGAAGPQVTTPISTRNGTPSSA